MNIKPGRIVMLLGGSGAGKTTYVNAIIMTAGRHLCQIRINEEIIHFRKFFYSLQFTES